MVSSLDFQTRREQAALTAARWPWLNNNRPDSVVSFMRERDPDAVPGYSESLLSG